MTIIVGGFAKRTIVAAMSAVVIAGGLMASVSPAAARPYWKRCYGCGWGWGYAGAGVAAGLALGAIAAATAYPVYAGPCYIARREVVDAFGNVYVRRVRVCD
jgi:hypothetical protein